MSQDAKINEQIRSPQVRLIGLEGEQLGIKSLGDALGIAREAGVDLVEVAPQAKPPVCKLMDYGKFKYRQRKRAHQAKAQHHRVHTKEIRLHPKTSDHDLEVKARHARKLLSLGDKIQVNVFFKGREMAHRELGHEVLTKFAAQLAEVVKVEQEARLEGRRMTMMLVPK
ncbi:MAG TPA: translation initiation factor IF-3 [Planctomycetota bacterium]|nr:translation initiation factor IF-3 [Planctomycetota bacterium]HRR81381.1 translation initiation factor IF-3 [Planctomycetota bacterium]HRT94539.1 translation initiation factor IF-3 [Planctomycetota bacterium]